MGKRYSLSFPIALCPLENKNCEFCGEDNSKKLYCRIAETGIKGDHAQSNLIERMQRCPQRRRHLKYKKKE